MTHAMQEAEPRSAPTKGIFPDVPFLLAASSEMLFLELPLLERVKRIDAAGFLVEIWDWTRHDIDALAASGVTFSSMTGYVRGRLADRDGAEELVATAKDSIAVAKRLGVPRLNLHGAGLGPEGLPLLPATEVTGAMWLHARDMSAIGYCGPVGLEGWAASDSASALNAFRMAFTVSQGRR